MVLALGLALGGCGAGDTGSGGAGGDGGSGGSAGGGGGIPAPVGPRAGVTCGPVGAGGGGSSVGRDPNCPPSTPYIAKVTGTILDENCNPIEGARAGFCLRYDLGNPNEQALCLQPQPSNAQGVYTIDVPAADRCVERAAMRVFYYNVASPLNSSVTLYCEVDLPTDKTELHLPPYILYQPDPPADLPAIDPSDSVRTITFADHTQISLAPDTFFGTYSQLAMVSMDPAEHSEGLCFLSGGESLTRVFGIRPDGGPLGKVSFPVVMPNAEGLPPNSTVKLYILGGLAYKLADDTQVPEGAWVQFGTATVSADGATISGDPLPYLNWFGYGP